MAQRIFVFVETELQETHHADIPSLLESDAVFWIDIHQPSMADFQLLESTFRFHPLAVEDTRNGRQRPKAEDYGEMLFVILNAIRKTDTDIFFDEIDVFMGKNYVVTVHDDALPLLDQVVSRCNRFMHPQIRVSSGYLLYVISDVIVDGYFPILEAIGDELDTVIENVLKDPRQATLERVFILRRILSEMWRVASQKREIFTTLARKEVTLLDDKILRYYLRDVHDHLIRVTDQINTFRDTVSNIVDLYLSSVSNRLNNFVQRLTIATVGIGVIAAIGGFYGMNFEHTFPAFHEPWGVWFALGLMALTILGIIFYIRRVK